MLHSAYRWTLRTLDDLVSNGKIRYVGFSDVPAWATAEAATIARFRGWAPIVAVQLQYSLLERTSEGELIPMSEALGMGVMPWSPLHRGLLSGKRSDTGRQRTPGGPTPAELAVIDAVIDAVSAVAEEVGATPAEVALSWVQGRPGVTSTLIGSRTVDQLEANLGALAVTLSEDQRAALDEVSAPKLNFPAENNRLLAPNLQFAGATVDGRSSAVSPLLHASAARY